MMHARINGMNLSGGIYNRPRSWRFTKRRREFFVGGDLSLFTMPIAIKSLEIVYAAIENVDPCCRTDDVPAPHTLFTLTTVATAECPSQKPC
ncbi:hypothetical protein TNCV_2787991 [Trichonephila clavipes]|uniref:Uncharacterized protein n=1 Tax=Trichonephila clavipes TaxID=2585209 RepID=A0A8X6SS27_TRICX|nr:hypothetical protein TNCV_2787991 [Trichonephila clavipes]